MIAIREEIALEIGAQPVAHHRNGEPVGHPRQLPHLLVGQELRLVDEHAMRRLGLVMLGDALIQVVAVAEHLGVGFQPDARRDVTEIALLAVVAGDEQQRVHAAFAVIERRLQQHRRLAGIHGRVVEIELGHERRSGVSFAVPNSMT